MRRRGLAWSNASSMVECVAGRRRGSVWSNAQASRGYGAAIRPRQGRPIDLVRSGVVGRACGLRACGLPSARPCVLGGVQAWSLLPVTHMCAPYTWAGSGGPCQVGRRRGRVWPTRDRPLPRAGLARPPFAPTTQMVPPPAVRTCARVFACVGRACMLPPPVVFVCMCVM